MVVLYRYRAIAISVFILTTLAVIIQNSTAVPMYRAHARILIESERSTAIAGLNAAESQFYEDPEPYYNTQYKILQGRDLARRVVGKLQLHTIPEFNGTAPSARTWRHDRGRLRRSRARTFQTQLAGRAGTRGG